LGDGITLVEDRGYRQTQNGKLLLHCMGRAKFPEHRILVWAQISVGIRGGSGQSLGSAAQKETDKIVRVANVERHVDTYLSLTKTSRKAYLSNRISRPVSANTSCLIGHSVVSIMRT